MPPDSDPPVRALRSEQRQRQQDKRSAESSVNGTIVLTGNKAGPQCRRTSSHGLQFNAQLGIIHVLYRCQTILLFYIEIYIYINVCMCVCV